MHWIEWFHFIELVPPKECVGDGRDAEIGEGARQRWMAKLARRFVFSNPRCIRLRYLEEIETPLEGTQSNELISVPVAFAEFVINKLAMQFIHSGGQIVL